MDWKLVQKVVGLLQEHPLIAELEIRNMMGFSEIRIRRSPSTSSEHHASQLEDPQAETTSEITSPKVGWFLATTDIEEKPPLKEGDTIAEGDTVCYIEALGMQHPVESEVSGIVLHVLVEPGQPIEYGQKLFQIGKLVHPEQNARS